MLTQSQIQLSVDTGSLLSTAVDSLQFVTEFFNIISQSAPHIYHSALLLTPRLSVVWNLYSQQISSPVLNVICGIPASWNSCTASTGVTPPGICSAVWSPCGQFVASAPTSEGPIQILDSNTLGRVSILNFPIEHPGSKFLSFSPDGCLLVCAWIPWFVVFLVSVSMLTSVPRRSKDKPIIIWDVQTGVVINNKKAQYLCISKDPLTYFLGNHGTITLLARDGTFYMHNGLSGADICAGGFPPSSSIKLGTRWVHGEALRFSAHFKNHGKCMINIYELRLAPTTPLYLISSFPVPLHEGEFSFSPISFHASFVTVGKAVILNVRDSRILLQFKPDDSLNQESGQFSPDGCFFACQSLGFGIYIWKNTSADYVLWSNLQPQLSFTGFSFSPTKSSILTWGANGVQLLEPGNCPTSSPSNTPKHERHGVHLVAYSMDGVHVATARRWGSVVRVLDTLSNTTQQFLDANLQILAIKVVGNTIFAADEYNLVSWNLETGDLSKTGKCSKYFRRLFQVLKSSSKTSLFCCQSQWIMQSQPFLLPGHTLNYQVIAHRLLSLKAQQFSCMMYKLREFSAAIWWGIFRMFNSPLMGTNCGLLLGTMSLLL
jgi:hypothetical protein